MKDLLRYKEFLGTVHYSTDDDIFYGKIEGINDLVTFEGSTVKELKTAFHEAVEDYLTLCKELNRNAHKTYKGSFNIRINPDLHREASRIAILEGQSLNQLIQEAIKSKIEEKRKAS